MPDGQRILNWKQVWNLTELPEHLVVIGSGSPERSSLVHSPRLVLRSRWCRAVIGYCRPRTLTLPTWWKGLYPQGHEGPRVLQGAVSTFRRR